MRKNDFTLDDFMSQMSQVKRLGPMSKVMAMIPGMRELVEQMQMSEGEVERQMVCIQAVYDSLSAAERARPEVLNGSRRRRVARGAGVGVDMVSPSVGRWRRPCASGSRPSRGRPGGAR